MRTPRILVAGLRGGDGKTLVTLALLAGWRQQGRSVAAFKKGPDYIDPAWLGLAAGGPCRNLDLFLMPHAAILDSVRRGAAGSATVVVEGNRGLYDGADARGSMSSAELAKLLAAPVVLVLDASKCTRTLAASVLGCQRLDPALALSGVILNRLAGRRHEAVVREAITDVSGLPVLGALPRLPADPLPERHLGLVPPPEHGGGERVIEAAGVLARRHLELDQLWTLAAAAQPLPALAGRAASSLDRDPDAVPVRIGLFRDEAFQFYYPENLEALVREGAELVEVSPLRDAVLPPVDAVYAGGGFPESVAAALADNDTFRASVRAAAAAGMPIYAECGGAVYLGQGLVLDGNRYPMAGVLPAVFGFGERPQGHGYAEVEAVAENPFFPSGTTLRGHEFHYTFLRGPLGPGLRFAMHMRRGHGFDGTRDGLTDGGVLACYTHLHAAGTPGWAPAVVRAARSFAAAAMCTPSRAGPSWPS